jgi:CRP/FNR family cyclic AMP-dependent transcriptional regulator
MLKLAEISRSVQYPQGVLISSEGEVSDNLFIVKKGALKIVKNTGNEAKTIAVIGAGETYGELGLFTKVARSASAITEKECELYIIKRGEFKKLILKIPEITFNLLEVVSERLRMSVKELAELKTAVYGASESEFEQAL